MNTQSQAHQDQFVLSCLGMKRGGLFLDLGCNDPVRISNTYVLEKDYGWDGIAVDIDSSFVSRYQNVRTCRAVCADCTKVNFQELLGDISHFDYLSLDLEPASVTLDCILRIPFDSVTFAVITFEHDEYRFGSEVKEESREILMSDEYHRLRRDVKNGGSPYEDWYVHPNFVDMNRVQKFACESLEHTEIASRF